MTENEISYIIRGVILKVYNDLGPGLFESVYQTVLAHELTKAGLHVQTQVALPFIYDDIHFEAGFRIDILVENRVIIEVKSVEVLHLVHHKQILTYLRLTKLKLGILVNFNTDEIQKNIIRKVNNLKD